MTIKFAGIDAIPADGYILNFIVDGKDETIFCDGIEELMCTVLTEEEWVNWLTGGGGCHYSMARKLMTKLSLLRNIFIKKRTTSADFSRIRKF